MDETETKKVHLSPVSGWEAAIRSRARLSTRLRSVPEKHSVVSFVHDIRRRGLEPERRVSAVELCATTSVPVSPCSKTTLEPSDASTIVVKRRGIYAHIFFLANQMVIQLGSVMANWVF